MNNSELDSHYKHLGSYINKNSQSQSKNYIDKEFYAHEHLFKDVNENNIRKIYECRFVRCISCNEIYCYSCGKRIDP